MTHGTRNQQPSQMSIALFGDPAKPVFAAGRMLPRDQPNPGGETAARRKRRPITDLSDQGGSDDRANAGDFREPAAFFARPVQSMDVLLDGSDLGRDSRILLSKNSKAQAGDP
jgi:hypothetical protein